MSDTTYITDGSHITLADTDGDGYEETTYVHTDNDHEVDAIFTDTDGDGFDDLAEFDNSPGDGNFYADVHAEDTNNDGRVDRVWDDLDFDGDFDRITSGHHVDLGDSNPYGPDLQDGLDEVYEQL